MKAKISLLAVLLALALVVGVGCQRSRSDAQIASDVNARIMSDSNVQNKQLTVQSANGVVTLSGNVASEMERAAVANDAAQVDGVKTVVNNLQVAQAAMPPEPQAEPAPPETAPPQSARRSTARRNNARSAPSSPAEPSQPATSSAPPASASSVYSAPAPAPPPPPRTVSVPDGATLMVRLIDAVDSEQAQQGDTFRGTLSSPVLVGDEVAIPQGADIVGRVAQVQSAGHFKGQSLLALELTKVSYNGHSYNLQTAQWSKQGTSRGKRTAATIGGGAALGAIIGGLAGGGKGAAIGAGVGAGAGTGVQGVTKGQQIRLASETVVSFRLESPLTVVPSAGRDSGRQRLNE